MKMFLAAGCLLMLAVSCYNKHLPDGTGEVQNPITISSPTPQKQLTKVMLDEREEGYMAAGNRMAFRLLSRLYDGNSLICSPLSLQYALAMTSGGATGETRQEMLDFLGYGEDGQDALNAYCRKLLEQLPAVDLDVTLKLTDAILVREDFRLLPAFKKSVEENYYAAAENMSFEDPAAVAARINEWARRNTNGFIDNVLEPSDITQQAATFLMNALYFKAKWAGSEWDVMFNEQATYDEQFTREDGSKIQLPMMHNVRWHRYAECDGYKVLALPYAGGKFCMYIILPDGNNLGQIIGRLQQSAWADVLAGLKQDAEVHVKLPRFEIENKHNLKDALQVLGIKKAFVEGAAEFDGMFMPREEPWVFWIEKVIQKARISVTEWGTEAAAVTVVEMDAATDAGPDEHQPKQVYFNMDHPFAFVIGEATSGAILFEGVYSGK